MEMGCLFLFDWGAGAHFQLRLNGGSPRALKRARNIFLLGQLDIVVLLLSCSSILSASALRGIDFQSFDTLKVHCYQPEWKFITVLVFTSAGSWLKCAGYKLTATNR